MHIILIYMWVYFNRFNKFILDWIE